MKDALLYMMSHKETADDHKQKSNGGVPHAYERIIQKLEADIRGHIRLEHEMKIHMDYLEGKTEKMEREQKASEKEQAALKAQIESL